VGKYNSKERGEVRAEGRGQRAEGRGMEAFLALLEKHFIKSK
jgi:hypothetical protein